MKEQYEEKEEQAEKFQIHVHDDEIVQTKVENKNPPIIHQVKEPRPAIFDDESQFLMQSSDESTASEVIAETPEIVQPSTNDYFDEQDQENLIHLEKIDPFQLVQQNGKTKNFPAGDQMEETVKNSGQKSQQQPLTG